MFSLRDLIERLAAGQRRYDPHAVLLPAPLPPPLNEALMLPGLRLLSHTAVALPPAPLDVPGEEAGIVHVCDPDTLRLPFTRSRYGDIENLGARVNWSGGGGRGSRDSDSGEGVPPSRTALPYGAANRTQRIGTRRTLSASHASGRRNMKRDAP